MKNVLPYFVLTLCILPFLLKADADDTTRPLNSFQVDLGGEAIGGIGLGYERLISGKQPEKNVLLKWSASAGCSFFSETYLNPGTGLNVYWLPFQKNKIAFITGISAYALIALHPTPKAIREIYRDSSFYGGRYINPVEPALAAYAGVEFPVRQFYLKTGFTPLFRYDRVFTHRFLYTPWAGISFGYKF